MGTPFPVSLSAECCITVCDAGPTLKQHWIDVSRLLELQLLFQLSNLAHKRLLVTIVNMQGRFNGGHPSATLALH